MLRCVLCQKDFVPSIREHILPNAFGWTLDTDDIVCPSCNAAAAANDAELVSPLATLVNLVDPAGRRTPAPTVSAGSTTYVAINLSAGGIPQVPKVMPVAQSDGSRMLLVDDTEIAALEEKLSGRGRRLTIVERVEGFQVDDMKLHMLDTDDPRKLIPSLAKAALHATALWVPDWDRKGAEAEELRSIVLDGAKDLHRIRTVAWDFDQGDLDESAFYNAIEVTACPQMATVGVRIHVLGMVRVRVLVTSGYRGSVHSVLRTWQGSGSSETRTATTKCGHPFAYRYTLSHERGFPIEKMTRYFNQHRSSAKPEELYERAEATYSVEKME